MAQEEVELALRAKWMDLTFCIIDITIFILIKLIIIHLGLRYNSVEYLFTGVWHMPGTLLEVG